MLPLHKFDAQKSGWFVPTPVDVIDMVRDLPSQGLAIQLYKRGSERFLDSAFGRRMRTALITSPEGRPVPLSVYAGSLDVRDDFELQRAYQLAVEWTRSRHTMDAAAHAQMASMPSASDLRAQASASTPANYEHAERHPVTPAGLERADEAAGRLAALEATRRP
jgi:hypothetical protein